MKKRALVTGASSGIGKEIAIQLRDHGMEVIGLCRSVDDLPEGVAPLPCDLTDENRIREVFATIDQLDILVNSAGLALMARIHDGSPADWSRMWQVNVQALTICSQLALEKFPESGGHILNISSLSGHRVPPTGGFYAATKFAVRAIGEALRSELKATGSSTRVSSISPGFVETPLIEKYFAGRENELAETKAKVEMLDPKSVAEAALHILTAPSSVEINDLLMRSTDQAG